MQILHTLGAQVFAWTSRGWDTRGSCAVFGAGG